MIKIKIKGKDIKKGIKHNCEKCPAALAMRRKLNKLGVTWDRLSVGDDTSQFSDSHLNRVNFRNPYPMRRWIAQLDRGDPVKPAMFLLEVM